ncbi:MAG: nicotinamide-nucleotide amidohydrolase family protein [Treponema sp.]|nr:nicotinamide-nucleotide amidohydrolase family protein [Treponema sp.]
MALQTPKFYLAGSKRARRSGSLRSIDRKDPQFEQALWLEEPELALLADTAEQAAELLLQDLSARSAVLALAESCTAGLVADILAGFPGASRVFWGSFVCYTAKAKIAMLGLDRERLERYGLVSEDTARSMAFEALRKSGADIAASVTGLAGPDGDGSAVPVGTVWIAVARKDGDSIEKQFHFTGSRNAVRLRAAAAVLEELLKNSGLA